MKMSQLTGYERKEDLLSYLDKYASLMELQGASDAIICQAFHLTLRDKV